MVPTDHTAGGAPAQHPFRCAAGLVGLALLAFGSGGCSHDLSQSPSFRQLVGKCFVLKQDVFLWSPSYFEGKRYLCIPGEGGMPESVEAWETRRSRPSDPWDSGVDGVVRAGTRLRIEKLISDLDSSYPYHSFAVLLDGPFKDRTVNINDLFKNDREGAPAAYGWQVDDRYAVPCPDAANGTPG